MFVQLLDLQVSRVGTHRSSVQECTGSAESWVLTQARAAQNVDVLGHTLATCLRAGKQSMGFSLWTVVPCWNGSTGASPLPALGTCGGIRNLGTEKLCENIRVLLCVLQHACMTCSDDCCSICQACRM